MIGPPPPPPVDVPGHGPERSGRRAGKAGDGFAGVEMLSRFCSCDEKGKRVPREDRTIDYRMGSTTKTTRFGQFTLAGGLGYTTLVAASLSVIRLGIVAEWYWIFWPGLFTLGAEIGLGLAVIVCPRHKTRSALAGAILLPLVLSMYVALVVHWTHNRIKTIEPLPSADARQPQTPPQPISLAADDHARCRQQSTISP